MQTELFGGSFTHVLTQDADVTIWRNFLPAPQAAQLYAHLVANVPWQQALIRMAGRQVHSPRLQCWMGDADALYRYSSSTFVPVPWLAALAALKLKLQQASGATYNSVLLNWYRDGNDSMGWHADDEPELGRGPVIASLSLGATRRMLLRHKLRAPRAKSCAVDLSHGDLLLMQGATQQYWQHALPKVAAVCGGRINLTYRMVKAY